MISSENIAKGSTTHRDGLWARTVSLLASGWLIVSAFAWDPSGPARTNAGMVGYLVFVASMVATLVDAVRVVNTLLGAWLVVSTFLFPAAGVMRINTALLGLAVVVMSLVSTREGVLRLPLLHRANG
ncbi:MAG TPA: hypothetical protein VFG59_01675 [Anaeromyxobacter sp.]|nr:hypothetical protein [Anaeromyxobacter sp.]